MSRVHAQGPAPDWPRLPIPKPVSRSVAGATKFNVNPHKTESAVLYSNLAVATWLRCLLRDPSRCFFTHSKRLLVRLITTGSPCGERIAGGANPSPTRHFFSGVGCPPFHCVRRKKGELQDGIITGRVGLVSGARAHAREGVGNSLESYKELDPTIDSLVKLEDWRCMGGNHPSSPIE